MNTYWYYAQRTDTFDFSKYREWMGVKRAHLTSLITLDSMLFPDPQPEIIDDDWPWIMTLGDSVFQCFSNLDYLLKRSDATGVPYRILGAVFEPDEECSATSPDTHFEFAGYDIMDRGEISTLTNCGSLEDIFDERGLLPNGLLPTFEKSDTVRNTMQRLYPNDWHMQACHVWAVWQMKIPKIIMQDTHVT